MLGNNFIRRHFEIFSYCSQKVGIDILCRLSPLQTICMKSESPFLEKISENINLYSAEFAQRVVKVKDADFHYVSKTRWLKGKQCRTD